MPNHSLNATHLTQSGCWALLKTWKVVWLEDSAVQLHSSVAQSNQTSSTSATGLTLDTASSHSVRFHSYLHSWNVSTTDDRPAFSNIQQIRALQCSVVMCMSVSDGSERCFGLNPVQTPIQWERESLWMFRGVTHSLTSDISMRAERRANLVSCFHCQIRKYFLSLSPSLREADSSTGEVYI